MSDASYERIPLTEAVAPLSTFSPLLADLDQRQGGPVNGPLLRDDAFTLGVIAGRREAEEQHALERDRLLALVAAADALQPEPNEELAALIAATIEALVTRIVGATPIDQAWLTKRIERAVSIIVDADEARTLWLHPDDLALVEGIELPLALAADPSLERGALRIGCSAGWIEDGRSMHLAALRSELGLGDPA